MHARTSTRVIAGALAALGAAVAAPAFAQTAAPSVARPVALYNIASRNHDRTMPARVVLADSAGRLVANYWLASDSTAHAMGVIVYGDELVLVGETQRGVLEMVLENQLDGRRRGLFGGRWTRGDQEGQLSGRIIKG